MGGKNKGSKAADAARRDEEARQQRIREGTQRINSIFDGTTVGDGRLTAGTAFDPNATYYKSDGSVWKPHTNPLSMVFEGLQRQWVERGKDGTAGWETMNGADGKTYAIEPGDGKYRKLSELPSGLASASAQNQYEKMLAEGGLYSGVKQTGGFNNDFFEGRKQAYMDYANPQMEDQYGKAQKQLAFALARNGTLDSSIRAQKTGELQQAYDLNKQQIADQALSYETQARNSVEDARSNLIATLNATGDAQGAANAALARSQALSQPAAFSPLTNLFADFTSTLGQQAAIERANYYSGGKTGGRYNTGLFAPSNNSVKLG